ncbi:MAG: DUF3253 domain-containing protein [Polaromonas sp.]
MPQPSDPQIEAALLALIAQRGHQASACPSEVARALSPDDWRTLMPRVRQMAGQLALRGLLDISQGGQSVPASSLPNGPWKGPIRVRLPRAT